MREKRVDLKIPAYVREMLTALETAGHQAYCVGGCVRDSLLGRTPEDWDVTTSALPEETMKVFGDQAIPTGLKHGTVTVCCQEGKVETTTFRRDGAYADHRHPEQVTFTPDLTEDLTRRDFTVNAMATDLRGTVYDPFDGQADLQEGILRCVGDPERRFSEDALRILRCLRFAAVLGFSIEPETGKALMTCRDLLREMAPERVHEELTKLLCGPWAPAVLRQYPQVVGAVLPEILPMVGFDQRNGHHCYDVWEHTLHAMEKVKPEPELRLTMLLHDIGKPNCFTVDGLGCGHFYGHPAESARMAEAMLGRLRAETVLRETVVQLVAWHDRNIPRTRPGVARALGALGERDLRRLLDVKRADNLAQAPAYRFLQGEIDRAECILDQLLVEGACVSLRQLAVNGRDLLAMGLSGPAVGQTLRELLNAVLDDSLPNERHALLAAVRDRAHRG